MDSLIASIRQKFSRSWPASKLSDGSSSNRQHMKQKKPALDASSDEGLGGGAETLVHVGKPMGVSRQYDTSVEAMQMSALDNEPGMEGIHVKSRIEHDHSFV